MGATTLKPLQTQQKCRGGPVSLRLHTASLSVPVRQSLPVPGQQRDAPLLSSDPVFSTCSFHVPDGFSPQKCTDMNGQSLNCPSR